MMNNFDNRRMNLHKWIFMNTEGQDGVVELGAGFFDKLSYVHSDVKTRIGIEIFEPYIKEAKFNDCVKIVGDMRKYRELIPEDMNLTAAMMIDSLEHLTKKDGIELIGKLKEDFELILLMLPVGEFKQTKDVTGYGNHKYQTHRSTWMKDDIKKLNFSINVIDPEFHSDRLQVGLNGSAYFGIWRK